MSKSIQYKDENDLDKSAQIALGEKVLVITRVKYVSQPEESISPLFSWAYEVTIQNHSTTIVQLLNRFWRIIDMSGKIEEVRGPGVIGLQPLIKPGKEFVYTSMCQLATPQGTMEGCYEMQDLNDVHFDVVIPKFILSAPKTMVHLFRSRLH